MKFQLFLDKQVYRCGEVVTGRIECWRTRTFTTYGCVLELCGLEQVRHRLGSSSAYGVRSTQFLSSKVMLGRGPGVTQDRSKYFKLAAGEHVWPFRIELPRELPPSVSHPDGNARIVYEVRASMSNPGDRDGKAFALFTLTSLPLRRPARAVEKTAEKAFGRQRNEPIFVRAQLQRDLFEPGQLIKMRLHVDNASRRTANSVTIDVVRRWRYGKEREASTLSSQKVAPAEHFPLAPRAIFESVVGVRLPREMQQSVVGKELGCTYVLHVVVHTSLLSSNLALDVPFAIVAPGTGGGGSAAARSRSPSPHAPRGSPKALQRAHTTSHSSAPHAPVSPKLAAHLGYGQGPPERRVSADEAARRGYGAGPAVASTSAASGTPPRVVVEPSAPPMPPPPAGTHSSTVVAGTEWVMMDNSHEDAVDDLAIDQSRLAPYNPEYGSTAVLRPQDVRWGVSPRTSPHISPSPSPPRSRSTSPHPPRSPPKPLPTLPVPAAQPTAPQLTLDAEHMASMVKKSGASESRN